MNYLLDTNILLVYARNNDTTKQIEQELQLFSGQHNLVISVVSMGEIKSIAKRNNWGEKKMERLGALLSDFLVADIHVQEIIDMYAEIDHYSQTCPDFTSRNMSKNDIWIAATGAVLQLVLLTTDKDFDHLAKYISVSRIDLNNYKG